MGGSGQQHIGKDRVSFAIRFRETLLQAADGRSGETLARPETAASAA
jgi:hypothetical protein